MGKVKNCLSKDLLPHGLGYDYMMRFIGCDSIQSRSLLSDRFQIETTDKAKIEKNWPDKLYRQGYRLKQALIRERKHKLIIFFHT